MIKFNQEKYTKTFQFKKYEEIFCVSDNEFLEFGFLDFKIEKFGRKKIEFFIKPLKEGTITIEKLHYKIFGLPFVFDFNTIQKKYKSSINSKLKRLCNQRKNREFKIFNNFSS